MMTLMDLGFLAKNGSRFSPTPRMLRLGASYAGDVT
jgi:IclR family pca regulon transcriptional regulator